MIKVIRTRMTKVPFAKYSFNKATLTITQHVIWDGNTSRKTNAIGKQWCEEEEMGKSKKQTQTVQVFLTTNMLEAGRAT